jgi:hypothetical protein
MRELASKCRKLEEAVIQKSEKCRRKGRGAREDLEEESQRRSDEVTEEKLTLRHGGGVGHGGQ